MDIYTIKEHFEHALAGEHGKIVVLSNSPFILAAVNDSGRASLFIRVSLKPSQVISDGHGFSVKTTRSGKDNYVQITAADQGLPILFLKLVEYILDRVSIVASNDEGATVLIRSIEEYRHFFGKRQGRLTEDQVRGTFAELLFLRTIILAGMNADVAVVAWRGPWAKAGLGLHDFTFADGRGIEVKSTHQPPRTIRVSSLNQLVPSKQRLDLLVLPIEDTLDGSDPAIPFRQYAQETREIMAIAGPVALDKWDAALDALDLDLSDEWYDKYRFLPGEWQRFEVKEGFPYLDFPSLPAGIIDVRYSLELLRLTPFAASFSELLREVNLS